MRTCRSLCQIALSGCAAVLLFLAARLSAQSDTVWQYTAPSTIRFTRVDPVGHLLVVTDQAVIALNADSGRPVWTYPVGARVRLLAASALGRLFIGYDGVLAAVDPANGDTLWRRDNLPDLEHTRFGMGRDGRTALLHTKNGFLSLNLESGATRWDSTAFPANTTVREYFRFDGYNLLLLLARRPASDAAVLAVTLDSGRVLWHNDSLFTAKPKFRRTEDVEALTDAQRPLVLPDTSVIFYFSTDGPIRVNPRSGQVHWRATELAGKDVAGLDKGYPSLRLRDSLVLVPTGKQLVALDTATGRVRWRTAAEFRDELSWLLSQASPMLVGGVAREKPFLQAVDPRSGATVWPTEMKLKQPATAYFLRDTVYVSSDGWLTAVALATGASRSIGVLAFQGSEQRIGMDTVEGGGLVLWGQQNIMRVGLDGHVVYRRYYKAPGASFLAKLASTVLLVGFSAASIAVTPPGGVAVMPAGNPLLAKRYARAQLAQNYYYVFTESADTVGQKGYSLVLVDRRDGRELGRMRFDERSPHYGVDDATGTVYVREGDLRVIARRFRPDRQKAP
jgi:outer membrane protein assembly factor BamB